MVLSSSLQEKSRSPPRISARPVGTLGRRLEARVVLGLGGVSPDDDRVGEHPFGPGDSVGDAARVDGVAWVVLSLRPSGGDENPRVVGDDVRGSGTGRAGQSDIRWRALAHVVAPDAV